MREDLLARVPEKLPVMLDYKLLAESGSLHNTPPCFAIYMVGLVMKWLKELGGLPAIHKINQEKAGLIYDAIDHSGGFYRGHAAKEARSIMNVPFRMPSEELEDLFVKEAKKAELIGLKGHRSVGGLRASHLQRPARSNRPRPWSTSWPTSSAGTGKKFHHRGTEKENQVNSAGFRLARGENPRFYRCFAGD